MNMQLHHRIIHHLRKHKERIVAHVNKHHKKYIFGAGIVFGVGALKVMVIVSLFLGIQMGIGRSNASYEKLDMYKTLAIFGRIDDIVHQEIMEKKEGNLFITDDLKEEFYKIDTEYHSAKNINEEYKAERKMVDLLNKLEANRPVITGDTEMNIARDTEYRELLIKFYQIR